MTLEDDLSDRIDEELELELELPDDWLVGER
jgi:hypothetical protein